MAGRGGAAGAADRDLQRRVQLPHDRHQRGTGLRRVGTAAPRGRAQRNGLVIEAETTQLLGVALPLLGDLDLQVEVDAGAEERLDLLAGTRPDLLEAGAAGTDDDRLLALAFDI